jgi:hypothetical protein
VQALTAESVWVARLSRALGALPLADPGKVRLVHEILRVSATGDGSRGPTARVLWDELADARRRRRVEWSPESDEPAAA